MRFSDDLPDAFELDDDALDAGPDDPLDDDLDDEFPLGDGTADTEAEVVCPYCGEAVVVGLDPGGGATQQYVEDCQVCCQPWRLHVAYDAEGAAHVSASALDA